MAESSGQISDINRSNHISRAGSLDGSATVRVRPVQVLLALVGLILVCTYLADILEQVNLSKKTTPLKIGPNGPTSAAAMKGLVPTPPAAGMDLLPLKLRPKLCPNPSSPFNSDSPFPMNFWYVKTFKTGSTTLSSVFNNICAHYGIVWLKWDVVKNGVLLDKGGKRPTPLEKHMEAAIAAVETATDVPFIAITSHLPYNQHVVEHMPKPVLRFTSVRHPVSRTHSHFIQNLCYKAAQAWGWTPGSSADGSGPPGPSACDSDPKYWAIAMQNDTMEARWEFAGNNFQEEMMYYYLKGVGKRELADVLAQYDFIFVSERMNEALVIFMLEYGLTYEDIAYLPGKVRTGKYKSSDDMPKELNDFIIKRNPRDIEIWDIANKRLDDLRADLGESCGMDIVAATLKTFEKLIGGITEECANYVGWYKQHGYSGPYSWSGTPGIGDESGLGFRCVRAVARRFMAELAGTTPGKAVAVAAAAGKAELQQQQQQQQQTKAQYDEEESAAPYQGEGAEKRRQQQDRWNGSEGAGDDDAYDYVAGDGDVYDYEAEADYGGPHDDSPADYKGRGAGVAPAT